MYLDYLSLTDFRCYAQVDVELSPGITIFVGSNGQGKTNLVEAVEYLSLLGSHRASSDAPLVRHTAEQALVRGRARASQQDTRSLLLEVEINPGKANRARINRAPLTKPRELLGVLRSVTFSPEDLAIVKGDPSDRRSFIDGLVITRWPRMAGVKSDYERALKQRNSLLKSLARAPGSPDTEALFSLDVWDQQLASFGAELLAARLDTLSEVMPLVSEAYADIAPTNNVVSARYRCSVDLPAPLAPTILDGSSSPSAGGQVGSHRSGDASADALRVSRPGSNDAGDHVLADDAASELDTSPSLRSDPAELSNPGLTSSSGLEHPDGHDPDPAGTHDAYRNQSSLATPGALEALRDALLAGLQSRRSDELRRGVTLSGPHRDDVSWYIGDLPAKGYASHGECWSLALALRLGSYHLIQQDGIDPVLVLDDVFAELDATRRDRLAEHIRGGEQVFITAAVAGDIPHQLFGDADIHTVANREVSRSLDSTHVLVAGDGTSGKALSPDLASEPATSEPATAGSGDGPVDISLTPGTATIDESELAARSSSHHD